MTQSQPTLETPRLVLRPLSLADASDLQRLAGDYAIADTTLNIPHPYADGMAEIWIATQQAKFDAGEGVDLAVTTRATGELIGSVGLTITRRFDYAELGYWIGRPFWNQGYATEAAARIVEYGFRHLNLNRVHAHHFSRNSASGCVMQKLGMRQEGIHHQCVKKWDKYEDLVVYAILRKDWLRTRK